MAAALPAVSASTVIELREELIRFVTVESSKAQDRQAACPGRQRCWNLASESSRG